MMDRAKAIVWQLEATRDIVAKEFWITEQMQAIAAALNDAAVALNFVLKRRQCERLTREVRRD